MEKVIDLLLLLITCEIKNDGNKALKWRQCSTKINGGNIALKWWQ